MISDEMKLTKCPKNYSKNNHTICPESILYPESANMVRADLDTEFLYVDDKKVRIPTYCNTPDILVNSMNRALTAACGGDIQIVPEIIETAKYHFKNNTKNKITITFPTKILEHMFFGYDVSPVQDRKLDIEPAASVFDHSSSTGLSPRLSLYPTLGLTQYRILFLTKNGVVSFIVPAQNKRRKYVTP
nr:hypothetical protein [Abalone asfa-like virus]